MMDALKQGLKSYVFLFDLKDYKRWELVVKLLLSPLLIALNTALFLFTGTAFLLERLFYHPFRYFIRVQMRLYKGRMDADQAFKRIYSLGSFLVFLLFLPFNAVYFVCKLLKAFGKAVMKSLIAAVDFTDRYLREEEGIPLFDDVATAQDATLQGILKDLSRTEEARDSFAAMMAEMERKGLETEVENENEEEDV